MATPEIMGLLCAGCTNYHAVHGGHGSELTRAEIAGLLSGFDPMTMDLALAKFSGDIQSERRLIAAMRTWAIGIALNENWKVVRGRPTVSNMAAFAVFESVRPNRCIYCGGTGVKSGKQCNKCKGIKFKYASARTIASAMCIDPMSYARSWKDRYSRCLTKLSAVESDIYRVMRFADQECV